MKPIKSHRIEAFEIAAGVFGRMACVAVAALLVLSAAAPLLDLAAHVVV